MTIFMRKSFSVLLLVVLQCSLAACSRNNSSEYPTNELFAGAFVMEQEVDGEPTYTVIKGITIGSNLDTDRHPDIRMNLASGRLRLTDGENLSVTYLGLQQTLVRAGLNELRLMLEKHAWEDGTLYLSLYTDLFTTQIASQSLNEPLSLAFNRSSGEAVSLDVQVPQRAELTSPEAGLYVADGEDFEISWPVIGSGYQVQVAMQTISERQTEHFHRMWVPVEQGGVSFSEFMQNHEDVYGPGSYLPMHGTVKVSIKARQTHAFNDTPYHWAAVEVQRLESSVIIDIEE